MQIFKSSFYSYYNLNNSTGFAPPPPPSSNLLGVRVGFLWGEGVVGAALRLFFFFFFWIVGPSFFKNAWTSARASYSSKVLLYPSSTR